MGTQNIYTVLLWEDLEVDSNACIKFVMAFIQYIHTQTYTKT